FLKWARRHPTVAASVTLASTVVALSGIAATTILTLRRERDVQREVRRREELVALLDDFRQGRAIHAGPLQGDVPRMLRRNLVELRRLGWSLDDPPDRWFERLRDLEHTDPALRRKMLDGIYEVTADLLRDGAGPTADAARLGDALPGRF